MKASTRFCDGMPSSQRAQRDPSLPVVENLPAKAVDRGLIPGLGTKIPYTTGQVSTCITATEASESLELILCIKRALCIPETNEGDMDRDF